VAVFFFGSQHAGQEIRSRFRPGNLVGAQADRIIRHLEKFGAGYFALAAVTGVTPQDYRLIAGAVSEQGVAHRTVAAIGTEALGGLLAPRDRHLLYR
jgi:hypothetical protein